MLCTNVKRTKEFLIVDFLVRHLCHFLSPDRSILLNFRGRVYLDLSILKKETKSVMSKQMFLMVFLI